MLKSSELRGSSLQNDTPGGLSCHRSAGTRSSGACTRHLPIFAVPPQPRHVIALVGLLISISGCTTTYTVKRKVPAEIFLGPTVRVLGVAPFDSNDPDFKLTISEKLSAELAGSKVFDLVDRTTIDRAMAEIEQQSTDYFDQDTAVAFGKLVAAQALIIGRATTYSGEENMTVNLVKEEPYDEVETVKEPDGKTTTRTVTKYRELRVEARAKKRSASLDLNFKVVLVEKGQLLEGKTYNEAAEAVWIVHDPRPDLKTLRPAVSKTTPTDVKIWFSQTIDKLCNDFASKLLPQVAIEKIVWEPVSPQTDRAETYFKHGEFRECVKLLEIALNKVPKTDINEAKVNYLLGMTYACQQDFDRGIKYLQIASNLNPTDLHVSSIQRVKRWRKDAQELTGQLDR